MQQGDSQYLRKLWSHPVTGLPCELQLILGKTLEKQLGPTAASALFKSLKAGQRLWVKGVPQAPLNQSQLQDGQKTSSSRQALDVIVHDIEILNEAPPPFAKRKLLSSIYNKKLGSVSSSSSSAAFKSSSLKDEEYTGPYWGDDIPDENILLVDTLEKLQQASQELKASTIIGIDSEWQPFSGEMPWTPVALLQLATPDKAYLLDMLTLCGVHTKSFPPAEEEEEESSSSSDAFKAQEEEAAAKELLKELFQTVLADSNILKVGFGLNNDLKRLLESYPWLLQPTNNDENVAAMPLVGDIDLQALSRLVIRDAIFHRRRISLSNLTNIILGSPLDKMQQASDWGYRPLTRPQLRYAAFDAFCLVKIYQEILKTAPDGLLTEDRLQQLSASISDLSTLIYPSLNTTILSKNTGGESLAMRNYRMKCDEADTPPGRVYFKQQRPLGSSQDCTCNINALTSYFGRMVPKGGKVGVVRLATSDENGKMRHRLPRFPRGSGILEFRNAFLLFVNIPSTRYPNSFSLNGDGKYEMTWYPGKGQNLRHPGMQRLLGLLPIATQEEVEEDLSLGDDHHDAKEKKTVLLLCRPQRGPFIVCGRLAVAAVNGVEEDAVYGQTIVRWCLLDSEELRENSPVFESMLQLAGMSSNRI